MLPTGELGIFYEDLYYLVKPLHMVIHLASLPLLSNHGPA